ncbi:MAG: hypothetical protein AAGC91_10220 [Pseudomonadota bacterium]
MRITLAVSAVCLVAACVQKPVKGDPRDERGILFNDDQEVALKVDENAQTLRFTGDTKGLCDSQPTSDGCLTSELDTVTTVDFELQDSDDWGFSCFEICASDTLDKENCKLKIDQRLEYGVFVEDDPGDRLKVPSSVGKVRIRGLFGPKVGAFSVVNTNTLKADYYYRVQVCRNTPAGQLLSCKNDSSPTAKESCLWNEDPPWINKGRR